MHPSPKSTIQNALLPVPAKLWQRVIAFLLDLLLAFNLFLVIFLVYILPQKFPGKMNELSQSFQHYLQTAREQKLMNQPIQPMVLSEDQQFVAYYSHNILMLVVCLYFISNEIFLRGSSIGKKVFVLKVVKIRTGEDLSFIDSCLRSCLRTLSIFFAFPLLIINYCLVFFNANRLAGHDWISRTMVIEDTIEEDNKDHEEND